MVRTRCSSIVLLAAAVAPAFIAGCGGGGGGGGAALPALRVVVAPADNGRVAAPGTALPLKVSVVGPDGSPRSGVTVTLAAPRSGPGGSFSNPAPQGPNIFRGQTDANGSLTATITTGTTPGAFLIDAAAEGFEPSATVAITNLPALGTPALSAEAARAAVTAALLPGGVETSSIRLHGPILLPAGTTINSADDSPAVTVVTDRLSWFFWLDEAADRKFEHPVRYLILDAADSAAGFVGRARTIRTEMFPRLQPPGGVDHSVLPAGCYYDTFPTPVRTAPPAQSISRAPSDACAVIVHGPDAGKACENDVAKARDFLVRTGKVNADQIRPGGPTLPSTRAHLQFLIDQAKASGCKKLYLVISAHGSQANGGSFCLREAGSATQPGSLGKLDYVSYTDLTSMLQGFEEVCALVTACYSGNAVALFQNRGFGGGIATSANKVSIESYYGGDEGYSPWLDAMLRCWEDPKADGALGPSRPPDQHVDLEEALAWAKVHAGAFAGAPSDYRTKALGASPMASGLQNTTNPYNNIGDLDILNPGFAGKVVLRYPPGVTPDRSVTVTLTIDNPGVAQIPGAVGNSVTRTLTSGGTAEVGLVGVGFGDATGSVSARDSEGNVYRGSFTIHVGSGLSAQPSPVALFVNQSTSVVITRTGSLARLKEPVTINLTVADGSIVTATSAVTFPVGVTAQPIVVTAAFKPGTTTVTATHAASGTAVQIPVTVVQRVVLMSDLRLTPGGQVILAEGTVLTTDLIGSSPYIIEDYKISAPEPITASSGCLSWHMHAADGKPGIIVKRLLGGSPAQFERLGPFPDPDRPHCGYGHVIQPP